MKFRSAFLLPIFAITASALAEEAHWTGRYNRFGGVRPSVRTDRAFRKLFEGTVIRKVDLKAKDLRTGLWKLEELVREVIGEGPAGGFSFIVTNVQYPGYSKPLRLKAQNLSLASIIDALAEQGDFYWDFSAIKLTIRPPKKS